MSYAVFGIYKSKEELDKAIGALKKENFNASDISVLVPPLRTATRVNGPAVEGTLSWLVGVGSLVIPGIGPLLGAGPIVSALAGTGVGHTIGGLGRALISFGIPEYEAKRYEGYVKDGNMLLSVHTDDGETAIDAKRLLEITKAEDISSTGEDRSDDTVYPLRRRGETKSQDHLIFPKS